MRPLALALVLCGLLISGTSAADPTCKAKATKEKLTGEALVNFVKQCETDALLACGNKAAGKPDSDAFMDDCVVKAVGVGPRWCHPNHCKTTPIARAVSGAEFAGPAFAENNATAEHETARRPKATLTNPNADYVITIARFAYCRTATTSRKKQAGGPYALIRKGNGLTLDQVAAIIEGRAQ